MQEWEGKGRTPTLLPCLRNARPEKGLVGRAQLEQHGCPPPMLERKKWEKRPGALIARRTRGLGRPSFDARSRGRHWPPLSNGRWGEREKEKKRSLPIPCARVTHGL